MLPAWQASTNLLLLTPIQSVLTGHATARECHRYVNLDREILHMLTVVLQG